MAKVTIVIEDNPEDEQGVLVTYSTEPELKSDDEMTLAHAVAMKFDGLINGLNDEEKETE